MNTGLAKELIDRLRQSLPHWVYGWLQQAVDSAKHYNVPIHLVGGPVRDLLLGQPTLDLDLVVEGDAWPVAEAFATRSGGKVTRHAAFRTASVELGLNGDPFVIDFVTARRETYPQPAALPEVEPSHMLDDLFRRDFTINAMALRLDAQPTLLDAYGGLHDLNDQLIRVLHDQSFIDDPTRILRAARFAARFSFLIEPHTRSLIQVAVAEQMIERTSPQRMLNELWLLMDETQPERVLDLLHQWGVLERLGFVWYEHWYEHFAAARMLDLDDAFRRTVYWGLLVWPLNTDQRKALGKRYNLPSAERKLLQELPTTLPPTISNVDMDAVALDQMLRRYDTPTLRTLQIVAPDEASANIERYLQEIRPLPSLVTGNDLQTLGMPPGPRYKQLLEAVRRSQLSGHLTTREQAYAWLRQHVADE